MDEVWRELLIIGGTVLTAVIGSLMAPRAVERIRGTEAREKTKLDSELEQVANWRTRQEEEWERTKADYEALELKYDALREKCVDLEDQIRALRRRESELTKDLSDQKDLTEEHQRANQLLDRQVTSMRNDQLALLRRIALMERD